MYKAYSLFSFWIPKSVLANLTFEGITAPLSSVPVRVNNPFLFARKVESDDPAIDSKAGPFNWLVCFPVALKTKDAQFIIRPYTKRFQ
jgi:hypothetical protein